METKGQNKFNKHFVGVSYKDKQNRTNNSSIKIKTFAQAKWHEMGKVSEELKAMLPTLSPADVRRFYIPHHEAVILELSEQKFVHSARYLTELFDLDEETRRKAGPGTLIWKKPYLKDQGEFIEHLKSVFQMSEEADRKGDRIAQATALLDAALFFQCKTWEWWWVAEFLYHNALTVAELIQDDCRQTITLARYLYGRFLFNEMQDPQSALDYLNDAREASEGKIWNASKKLDQTEDSIHTECNVLLCKALLILAEMVRCDEPELAARTSAQAFARAVDSGRTQYIIKTLHERGKSYFRIGDVKHALQDFSKLLAIAKRIPDAEAICNAHIELAFTYKYLEDDANTEKHLHLFRENAANFGLEYKYAQAHYYTGEHFLSQARLGLSTVHLKTAFNLYNKLGLMEETDQARVISGISKGLENMNQYLNLILQSMESDSIAITKLCRWKNNREAFWSKEKQ